MPREHLLKIGVSGIRGVVGEFLTPGLACAFGQAFGTYVGRGKVLVGRDTRATGEMLQHAVQCGLLSAGCEVLDLGILPTPTIQMYVDASRARGAIALTASHNPPEYNALKLFNSRGLFFNHYERSELIDLYHQSEFYEAGNEEIGEVRKEVDAARLLHIQRVVRQLIWPASEAAISGRLDAVNGAGGNDAGISGVPWVRPVAISIDPACHFAAKPKPETLGEVAQLVVDRGCDIGFAQDPDGDRLAVIDETGKVLENDDVLALVVQAALERLQGDVVVNLTTSSVIDDIAGARGRRVYRTPVGEANVVERIQAVNAAIGGEGSSGGIIFPAVHLCRDSYSGMAMYLDRMAETGLSISQLANRLPRYHRKLGKVAFEHGRLGPLTRDLKASFPDATADQTDGLKLIWPDKWIHVRASNTEPLLRFSAEGKTSEAVEQLYKRVEELLRT
ncbi:MAG: hypothetical protein WKF37_24975 [Bryobacteraceae bacterium]